MEEKPVTDLVLLPSLELIPVESLPKRCGQELALLKQERKMALLGTFITFPPILFSGFFTGLSAWVAAIAWLHHAPILIAIFLTIICAAFFICSDFCLDLFIREVRAYRQKVVPPQLQVSAENELILSEMAHLTNAQIVTWNKRAQCAPSEEVDKRFLRGLKNERKLLSTNIETVNKLAECIKRDRFESEAKDEPNKTE